MCETREAFEILEKSLFPKGSDAIEGKAMPEDMETKKQARNEIKWAVNRIKELHEMRWDAGQIYAKENEKPKLEKLQAVLEKEYATVKKEISDLLEKESKLKKSDDAPLKKSVIWDDPNSRLKACTQGRNYHVSVNDIYDKALENMKKSEENPEVPAKSEGYNVNDVIEQKFDKSPEEIDRVLGIKDHKIEGTLVKSVDENEIIKSFPNLSEDEIKKLLGE
jgi:hypothetical protein